MVCLDTAFLADLFRKNLASEKKLEELVKADEEISFTVITLAELYFGAFKSNRMETEKAKIEDAKRDFVILEMNMQAAEIFGELMNKLEKIGKKVSERDVIIAAIAISKGENTIVTRNEKDFSRISQLTVLTY